MPVLSPIIYGLFPVLLGLVAAWFWRTIDAGTKARDATNSERKLWRQGRLDAEATHRENLAIERASRLEWQLKREAELASIAGILKDSNAANQLLAGTVATVQAHGSSIAEVKQVLTIVQQQIVTLSSNFPHAKHP